MERKRNQNSSKSEVLHLIEASSDHTNKMSEVLLDPINSCIPLLGFLYCLKQGESAWRISMTPASNLKNDARFLFLFCSVFSSNVTTAHQFIFMWIIPVQSGLVTDLVCVQWSRGGSPYNLYFELMLSHVVSSIASSRRSFPHVCCHSSFLWYSHSLGNCLLFLFCFFYHICFFYHKLQGI